MSSGLVLADARQIPLTAGCVQCVVTSPPYYALRDYGTGRWTGGDPECAHSGTVQRTAAPGTAKQASNAGANSVRSGACRCGALKIDGQIGLESTPELYVSTLVNVFRDVRRVLADTGVVWLNLGDSYAGSGAGSGGNCKGNRYGQHDALVGLGVRGFVPNGLKPKDLIGIPWRVALALQSDGWFLRSDVIWSKVNPMPESVTDRPTKAHEYIFLLSKSERYHYDAAAVAEPYARPYRDGPGFGGLANKTGPGKHAGRQRGIEATVNPDGMRNARTVWRIASTPYAGAHFATMPERLAEKCILAGSRPKDLVFDPFGGSGTTVRVARKLNRAGVMLDLSPVYLDLAAERISRVQLSLLDVLEAAG